MLNFIICSGVQKIVFGCIIFLQSKHIFGNYDQLKEEDRPMKLENTIIAVDFDNTLCFSNWPELSEPNLPEIQYLKQQYLLVKKHILCICRAGKPLEDAIRWCTYHYSYRRIIIVGHKA